LNCGKNKVFIKIIFCIYIVAIIESLINYRTIAPYAEEAHPYPDYSMPLLAAFGAAWPGARETVLHQSWDLGDFGRSVRVQLIIHPRTIFTIVSSLFVYRRMQGTGARNIIL